MNIHRIPDSPKTHRSSGFRIKRLIALIKDHGKRIEAPVA